MEAASQLAIKGSLPKRLIDFFARYPPRLYGVYFTNETVAASRTQTARERSRNADLSKPTKKVAKKESPLATLATVTATSTPNLSNLIQETPSESIDSSDAPLIDPETSSPIFESVERGPNPFLPYRNPATGRWRGAQVSLRRQAELFKLARYYGVEPLLPASRKSTQFKEQRLLERAAGLTAEGVAVRGIKGTGEGDKVKGHIWERRMGSVLERRIAAMEKMPELIREWRMRGNGKKWKKFPSSKSMKA